jgi:hypothetical protein
LKAVFLPEAFLEWMDLTVLREPLDGCNARGFGLNREHGTRLDCPVINQDSAGAAEGGFTSDMRTGETDEIADVMDKQHAGLDLVLPLLSVQGQSELHRGFLDPQ